jgi:predicted dinucleotide-binding enzyme
MNIAIIGAGDLGTALGKRWSDVKHEVVYGVRNNRLGRSDHLAIKDAVLQSEVVVLAVPWLAVPVVLSEKKLFEGKVVVDCTNPINDDSTGLVNNLNNGSGGEFVGRLIPESRVVKAFNTCSFNIIKNPTFASGLPAMFMASDYEDAKNIVVKLGTEIGFQVIDAGNLSQAIHLESLAWLRIHLSRNNKELAFQVMQR